MLILGASWEGPGGFGVSRSPERRGPAAGYMLTGSATHIVRNSEALWRKSYLSDLFPCVFAFVLVRSSKVLFNHLPGSPRPDSLLTRNQLEM